MAWNLDEAVMYYKDRGAPSDQYELIAFLKEMQEENSFITKAQVKAAAEALNVKETYLLAIIKRIPSLHLEDKNILEICSGPVCSKRKGVGPMAEKLCRECGGKLEIKYVNCMRQCGKGPNIKYNGVLYNNATDELLIKLIKG